MEYAWERKIHAKFSLKRIERIRPLGRFKHRWEENIKMDFRK
jgi:hypothetical protein